MRELIELAREAVAAVQRGAAALERIAELAEQGAGQRRRRREPLPEEPIEDTDRAAARAAARRLGLHVRKPG